MQETSNWLKINFTLQFHWIDFEDSRWESLIEPDLESQIWQVTQYTENTLGTWLLWMLNAELIYAFEKLIENLVEF